MKSWRLILGTLSITLMLFIMSFFSWGQFIRNAWWTAAKPISLGFQYSFGRVPPMFKNLIHLNQILKQNKDLVSENLQLQSELAKLSEVKYENEILKKELNFAQTQESEADLVPAAIIGRTAGYLKSMTIDKGEKDGLKKGQAVISQGFLVGTVSQTMADSAEVILITNFNSLVPVVLEISRGTGLLRGGLQGLTVEDIPLNIEIRDNENVTTSGLGGEIPAGIAIGKVVSVISRQGEIFQKVTVASPIDFSRLEVLFVIKK